MSRVTNSKEIFIEKAAKIHNNKYDYSKVKYVNVIDASRHHILPYIFLLYRSKVRFPEMLFPFQLFP